MATDIAPLVTATYDTVVTAPDDGDAANAASITTPILSALNRIESVRTDLGIATPWVRAGFLEDFDTAVLETGAITDYVLGDTRWFFDTSTVVGDYTPIMNAVQPAPDTSTRGLLNVQPGVASTCRIRKGFKTYQMFRNQEIVFRIMHDVVTSSGQSTEIGVMFETALTLRNTVGTEHALSLYWNPAVSADWQIRRVNAGSETLFPITGSAPTAGVFQELRLNQTSLTSYFATVDGVAQSPVASSLAGSPAGFQMKFGFGAAGQGVQLDYVRHTTDHTNRI